MEVSVTHRKDRPRHFITGTSTGSKEGGLLSGCNQGAQSRLCPHKFRILAPTLPAPVSHRYNPMINLTSNTSVSMPWYGTLCHQGVK